MRRGQVTLFIVVAIAVIAFYALVVTRPAPPTILPVFAEKAAVESLIASCVEITAKEAVEAFGLFGGGVLPVLNTGGFDVPYYYDHSRLVLPSDDVIARDILSPYVNQYVPECVKGALPVEGVIVRGARINQTRGVELRFLPPTPLDYNIVITQAVIEQDRVRVRVEYPVIVEKGDQVAQLVVPYSVVLPIRLGRMLVLGRQVVASHREYPQLVDWPTVHDTNSAGQFNMTYLFPVDNGGNPIPYNVVYQIIDPYLQYRMLFAIGGSP
ncbi:hypothetical protein HY641_00715 [Candidatus Woesearchaeota archaeon]|nr:hypothetical protein [Candidatus Woesearchaeota archaeon]